MHLNRSYIVFDASIQSRSCRVDGDFNSNSQHLQGCLLVCSLFACNARLEVAQASRANSCLGTISLLGQRLLDRLVFFPSSSVSPSFFCVLPVLKDA